ncbi:porin family protein [Neisseria animaloris]|uniref:porin family protein n=1 Tax=Neisseria animaloris TaxID=326522 RepID=UPI000D309A80|nr:porin family protein [Neisseria animaloris]
MKKALLTVLILGSTAIASAESFSDTFTGPAVEVGVGVSKTDVKHRSLNEKHKADVSVRGNYNVEYGNNWIGGAEVALKPLNRKISNHGNGKVKQKYDASVSYLQGYRFAQDAMVYGKVGYHYGKFDNVIAGTNRHMNGLGYGAGLKYAVTPNVEVGGEWEQTRYKRSNNKATNNSYMATIGYRFK